jgi:hypothetical protein
MRRHRRRRQSDALLWSGNVLHPKCGSLPSAAARGRRLHRKRFFIIDGSRQVRFAHRRSAARRRRARNCDHRELSCAAHWMTSPGLARSSSERVGGRRRHYWDAPARRSALVDAMPQVCAPAADLTVLVELHASKRLGATSVFDLRLV